MAIQVYFDGVLIRQLGAYIKTDLSAVRQINGVATGVIAALGLAEAGAENTPYTLLSHADAVATFKSGPLVEHIKTMFLGGAGQVVGIRIGAPQAATLSLDLDDGTGTSTTFSIDLTSIEKSNLSNSILAQIDFNDAGTTGPGNELDDTILFTFLQKHPDCSVTKEIYEFPRQFNSYTVLYERNHKLYFVQDWLITQTVDSVPLINTTVTPNVPYTAQELDTMRRAAILEVLKDYLLPDDAVQIFAPADPVPLGLIIYEIDNGGLFGYENSRMVTSTVNSLTADYTTLIPDLFDVAPSPFYVSPTYAFTTVAKTTYTTETLLDPNNAAIISNYYALSGGSNGDDGTGLYGDGTVTTTPGPAMNSWVNGLDILTNEEVNFVQPAYRYHYTTSLDSRITFFNAVMGYVLSHDKLASSVNQRHRRTSIIGFPAPQLDTYDKATYLSTATSTLTALTSDTDRAQDWIAPFKSSVPTGSLELLGGEYFASYIAGKMANKEPQISITFDPVGSLGADFLYDWTYSEKDTLIGQRFAFVEKVKSTTGAVYYRVHHNPTSWLGSTQQGYQEFVLRRIDDYVSTYLFKNVEDNFIGRPSYGAKTSGEIQRFVEGLLSSLVGKQLVAFRDVTVTPNSDNTVYNVSFYAQPVTEIKFILMTMRVRFDLNQ